MASPANLYKLLLTFQKEKLINLSIMALPLISGLINRFTGGSRRETEPITSDMPVATEQSPVLAPPSAASPEPKYTFPAEEHRLNASVHNEIRELFSLITFREANVYSPGMEVRLPLSRTEFQDTPAISRLLHLRGLKKQSQAVDVGVTYGWYSLYDEPPFGTVPLIPRLASLDISTNDTMILIDAQRCFIAKNNQFDDDSPDNLISANVLFDRKEGSNVEDLFAHKNVNPLRILAEMKTIMGRLKQAFELQEQARAVSLLTPRQAAAVEALAKRLVFGPNDRYLVLGDPNSQGKLEKLSLVFSRASANRSTDLKQPVILDRKPISWLTNSRVIQGDVSIKASKQTTRNLFYSAEGETSIRRDDRHLAETIVTSFDEILGIEGAGATIENNVGMHFVHFLRHQAKLPNMEEVCHGPVILATSAPFATRF